MGRGVYMDWLKMLDNMTPDDILTGPVPRDIPKYASIMLDKMRTKFSGITDEERACCRDALSKFQEEAEERAKRDIEYIARDRVRLAHYAAQAGITRAEREARNTRLSELGIPRFVEPDGPDAAIRVIRLASMRGSERVKIMNGLLHSFGCEGCDRENGCDGTCDHDGLQESVCLSEWKWIQKAAERCIEKGETVYPEPRYPKKESERHGTD